MNTDIDNIWIALAETGRAKVSYISYVRDLDWNEAVEVGQRWIRNELNSEAALEGVSLRINSLPNGAIDVYLRKFT